MKITLNKLAAAVSAATLASTAHAGVISTSVSLNQLLSGSTAYNGSFTLEPFLAANGLAGGTINSATISAYGFSDTQINQGYQTNYFEQVTSSYGYSVQTGSYSYSCGSWWSRRTCHSATYGYARYSQVNATRTYDQIDSVADTMRLTSMGESASDTVERTRSNPTTTWDGSYTRNNGTYGYDNVNVYDSITIDAMSGALFAELTLGASELLALAQSGSFDYLVAATTGNMYLRDMTISLDVSARAVTDTTDVPEPASAALVIAGLAGMAAAARRRRRNSQG
jgi:hypothetical protein